MLPYELFDGREAAHFMYVKGVGGTAAVEVLDRRLDDDTWRRAPAGWFELLRWLEWKKVLDVAEVDRRAKAFAHAVGARPRDRNMPRFTEALRIAMGSFVAWAHDHDLEVLGALVTAVTTTTGPGEAGVVADLLERDLHVDPDGPMQRVAAWLLTQGVAELTSPARRQVALTCLLLAREPAHLATAIRLLVRAAPSSSVQSAGPDGFGLVWDRIERFDPGGPSEDDVVDLLERLVGEVRWHEVYPKLDRHPHCVRLLVRSWLRGPRRFNGPPFIETVLASPPDAAEFIGIPLATLHDVTGHLRASEGRPFHERATADRWARLVSSALITAAGGITGVRNSAATRLSLRQWSGWPIPAAGVEAALRDAIAASAPTPLSKVIGQILDDQVDVHFRVSAAILALEGAPGGDLAAPSVPVPPDFADHLVVFLNTPWRKTQGLSSEALFKRTRRVEFAALERDLQVDFRDDVLLVHDGYPRMLAGSAWRAEERLALLSLFVVHEAIHHAQNIGEKDAVARLRETGHEHALMHLDLSADHAAALIVASAVPRWDVLWLKDIQGRSIADFPSTSMHPFGSRARKAARVTGLRLDYLVRRHMPAPAVGDGFLFPTFSPTGGPFQVLTSGPPVGVMYERSIDAKQATTIMSVLDRRPPPEPGSNPTEAPDITDPIDRLDRVLRDVLGVRQ